jgi:hypothetical protein
LGSTQNILISRPKNYKQITYDSEKNEVKFVIVLLSGIPFYVIGNCLIHLKFEGVELIGVAYRRGGKQLSGYAGCNSPTRIPQRVGGYM